MTRFVVLGIVVAVGVAMGLAWGMGALAVYVFFAAIAAALVFAASVGGDWLTTASRRRFDDRPRS
jgi:hypothetical protein